MKRIVYNKLVRDKIPEIIQNANKIAVTEVVSDEEYLMLLDEKFVEESKEYYESRDLEELADVLEVIYSIVKARGISIEELENIRKKKLEKRGSFGNKVFLKEVVEE